MKKFKRGDIREDGKVFIEYDKSAKNGERWGTQEQLENRRKAANASERKRSSTKEGHIKALFNCRKKKALKDGSNWSISYEHVLSIAPDICPIFKTPLSWGEVGKKYPTDNSPSLDKIQPELGYKEGNVAWLSQRANRLKNNMSIQEVESILNWMKAQA